MTSIHVFIMFLLLSNVTQSYIQGESKPVSINMNSMFSNLIRMYTEQGTVTIIHDEENGEIVSQISCLLERRKQMMFSYHQVHTALVPVMENLMEHASLEQMRDQLQFLVVCELTCVERLFKGIMRLDWMFGQGSLLRHFSSWLIISTDEPPHLNITLDNVAWIPFRRELQNGLKTISDIRTLLWVAEGREWSDIIRPDVGESFQYSNLFPNIERGLNGRELITAALEWAGHVIKDTVNNQTLYSGVGLDLVNLLEREFNFSYTIVESEDNLWGQQFRNGTINGVLGMISRKEAHLSPVPYAISLQRTRLIDLSSAISSTEYVLVYKRNITQMSTWLFLVSSYSWLVYLCGMVSLLWVILVLLCHHTRYKDHHAFCFDVFLRVPFRQDIQSIPKLISSRIMLFTWSLFCLMFAAVYTSNLVSRSAVGNYVAPFNTIQELIEQTDYKIQVFEGNIITKMLKESNSLVYQNLYERLDVFQLSEKEQFGVAVNRLLTKILNEPCAAILPSEIKVLLFSKTCELFELREKIKSIFVGLPFPKHSPLQKLFEKQLQRVVSMGLYDRFKKEWYPKPTTCPNPVHRLQFTLDHLKSGFIVVSCCILVCGCVLLVEKTRKPN